MKPRPEMIDPRPDTGVKPVRMLVADDHPIVREGMKSALAVAGRSPAAGEAGTARDTLDAVADGSYDLLVLAMNLSDRGYQVLCRLAMGRTVGQIADASNLGVTTGSTSRVRILKKLARTTNGCGGRHTTDRRAPGCSGTSA
jgi:DNA-binding NarL/FixJ family response regulator